MERGPQCWHDALQCLLLHRCSQERLTPRGNRKRLGTRKVLIDLRPSHSCMCWVFTDGHTHTSPYTDPDADRTNTGLQPGITRKSPERFGLVLLMGGLLRSVFITSSRTGWHMFGLHGTEKGGSDLDSCFGLRTWCGEHERITEKRQQGEPHLRTVVRQL